MEGGSHSNPCSMLGFGDDNHNSNNNVVGDDGLCPMTITVPPPHHHHHHNFFTSNTQYLALPPPPSNNVASSLTPHPAETSGGFFMEADHPSSSSCPSFSAVKAKIMAHPLYHRLLAAYVNCQKVPANPSRPRLLPLHKHGLKFRY